ncbi:hypothetical protein [Paraglaciecola sp. 25GB23A]|uniref:hypothetical protein n=1 Tax=Paraglaciecola sp. 25GB23A TaxID=3156068 RepID=UPI0032AFC999
MNYYITSEFEMTIGPSRLESLNGHPSTVYGLDSDLKIVYQNPASIQFSEQNSHNNRISSASSLGKNIFDFIPDLLAPTYKKLFESVTHDKNPSLISRQFEYECSSPEFYRVFSMHLYPLNKGGILVIHSLVIEEPYINSQSQELNTVVESDYINKHGSVTQCANCRRIKNLAKDGQWDWIPKWVKEPHIPTSHGICRPCKHHYYLSD